jgi:hypothetical protein
MRIGDSCVDGDVRGDVYLRAGESNTFLIIVIAAQSAVASPKKTLGVL